MRTAITKRHVDALKPAVRDVFLWDGEAVGFGVRVKPSGAKSFFVRYRNAAGRESRLTLGKVGAITVQQARALARLRLAEVAAGGDPAAERKHKRESPTLAELAARWQEEHAELRLKPSSRRRAEVLLRLKILPLLGRVRIDALTRADVARMHHALRGQPVSANRALLLLSNLCNHAERWNLRPDGSNPTRHVRPYREERRRRFLGSEELARLGRGLAEMESLRERPSDVPAVLAFRILLLTGARSSEIRTLRWEHVDEERGVLRLPDSKTGQKEILLGAPARDLLAAAPRLGPWVIPSPALSGPLLNLAAPWARLCARADIVGARIHDLRRTAASAGASLGVSLETVGQLLGHTQAATTKRYAFLFDDAKREAADRVSAHLAERLAAAPNVIPLAPRASRA